MCRQATCYIEAASISGTWSLDTNLSSARHAWRVVPASGDRATHLARAVTAEVALTGIHHVQNSILKFAPGQRIKSPMAAEFLSRRTSC